MDRIDTAVIGGGVVGLAVAAHLARDGYEVVLFEAEDHLGSLASSRNSEVIHAGLYYPTGSLRAQLCTRGRDLLYHYCASKGIDHQRVGKLVVATSDDQLPALAALAKQATINGCDVQILDGAEALAREPALSARVALWSPATGIVDSEQLIRSLRRDLDHQGGLVLTRTRVVSAQREGSGTVLVLGDGTELLAEQVVNSAGVAAPALAKGFDGFPAEWIPVSRPSRGRYAVLPGTQPFNHLVYPLPTDQGLGIHYTLDLAGGGRFGPDAHPTDDPDDVSLSEGPWLADFEVGPGLPARSASWQPAPGVRGSPLTNRVARRRQGRLRHPGSATAWPARPGSPVRHRVAGTYLGAGDR